MTGRASASDGRNVAQEVLRGDLGPYARNRVREILHGDAAPKPHAEPPIGSNLARHAWDELNRSGLFTDDGDFYGGMTGRAVMDLVDVFVEQRHSGMSASIVIDILRRVLAFEPLSPLTDDPAEWMEVTGGLWQSRRQAQAFSQDGGKTYRLNDDRATLHTTDVSGRG